MLERPFDTLLRAERAAVDQPVSLLSRIVGRSATVLADGQVGSRLRFCALRSADLRDSAPCTRPELLERAEHAFEHGYPVLLCGRFRPVHREHMTTLELHLLDIQPVRRHADLLCATPAEIAGTRERLASLRGPGALLGHILSEARVLLSLRGHAGQAYRGLQHAIALQAVSGGRAGENDRLSLVIFGQPGRSKRTLAQLAQLLAPVAMMGHGATLRPAALSGELLYQRDGSVSIDPGMLMRADGGVVVIEDLHALRRSRDVIQHALCQAAEEGRVMPRGAEKGSRPLLRTHTALYLDLNLDAALSAVAPGRTCETLLRQPGFTTELLSRMDVLACVDTGSDPERSARETLWAEEARPEPRPVEEDLVKRRRDLQLLLALLRDEIPEVDVEPAVGALCAGFLRRVERLQRISGKALDGEAFVRRGSRSLRKLAAAAARLRLSPAADAGDAELALSLWDQKIDTLQWLIEAAK
jgi:hypothetical protein